MNTRRSLIFLLAMIILIPAGLLNGERIRANNYYFELYGGSPLTQDWTDTSLITIDDDWSNPISIQGFRGDGLTSSTATDPQTILADGQLTTPFDVNANRTDPDTFATGGLTEFELADPAVALKGSATADAPHLMIYLNTTPCPETKSISISYKVRDLDGSAHDAVQQVALHYRIGTTGDFTNVPAGYVADATEPNAASKVTQVLANLPPAIIGHTQVELRIMTTNAAGTDEWIGIDDIEVGCYFVTAAPVAAYGRVVTPGGRGLYGAFVTLYNTETGETRVVRTNPFGRFAFTSLLQGGPYLLTVRHKRYDFSRAGRAFFLHDDKKDLLIRAEAPGPHLFEPPRKQKFR